MTIKSDYISELSFLLESSLSQKSHIDLDLFQAILISTEFICIWYWKFLYSASCSDNSLATSLVKYCITLKTVALIHIQNWMNKTL